MIVKGVCRRCGEVFAREIDNSGITLRERTRAARASFICGACLNLAGQEAEKQCREWRRRNAEHGERNTKAYRDRVIRESREKRGIINRTEE